jgi:hypothetical protein
MMNACDVINMRVVIMIKRLIKWLVLSIAAVAVLAVVGLSLLLTVLFREHKTEITLPEPTGQFAVGRTMYAWVNNAQDDELAPYPGAKRAVVVWIWYPAAPATSAAPAEYLP